MSDHLDLAAAIVGGCCAHCDDLVDERLALLDEAGLLASPEHDAAVAARAWDEGYGAGVHDERAAAEYNAGSPFAGVSPARVNPYERERGAS